MIEQRLMEKVNTQEKRHSSAVDDYKPYLTIRPSMTSPNVVPFSITPKQEQILQGAMRVFLSCGYAGTSMDRVATEASVSKQTIYSHFVNKEGLFKALLEWMTLSRFREVYDGSRLCGEPAILLRQIAKIYSSRVADQNYLCLIRLIIGESDRFPELAKLFTTTVIQQGQQLLSQYFEAHPELGIDDPEAVAQIFFGSLVSYMLVQHILHGKDVMPMDYDRLVTSLIHLVLAQSSR